MPSAKKTFSFVLSRPRLFFLFVALVLFLSNLNALVDAVLHPSIPYGDKEHLVVGGITAFATTVLFGVLFVYVDRLQKTLVERIKMEADLERTVARLQDARAEIKNLKGMLPICASCKRIKDQQGNWTQLEVYIRNHSEADFSHGICPECARRFYPELYGAEHSEPETIPG